MVKESLSVVFQQRKDYLINIRSIIGSLEPMLAFSNAKSATSHGGLAIKKIKIKNAEISNHVCNIYTYPGYQLVCIAFKPGYGS